MSQPTWKCVANLGDVNPLEYGGYFVYVDETGVYPAEAELLTPLNDGTYEVHRFTLDRCTFASGVLSDNEYHPDYPAWFAQPESRRAERPQDTTYLSCVAHCCGPTEEELRDDLCSDDPIRRAKAYRSIGEYHGFENLNSDPLTLTGEEAEERYREERGEEADPPPCPYGEQWEHVRTWEADGFRLDLWTAYQPFKDGPQTRMAYRLADRGEVIFKGNDYGCSPCYAVDSDKCIEAILGFLSLKHGDTDPEYFDDYTPRQIEWRDERAEDLQIAALDLMPAEDE